MNIKDVSVATGLPAKTIRYYEDINLIAPERSANGYRVFSDVDMHKLAFLARARSLGFPVESDQKLAELTAMRETLHTLVQSCAGEHRPDCPILADMAKGAQHRSDH